VFELTPPSGKGQWTASVIYTFQNGPDGAIPVPGLLFDPQGNLFGASAGSDSVAANVFELTPGANNSWTESVLFSFNDGSIYPPRGPIMDGHGNLFGTTEFGGPAQSGNVYKGSQKGGRWTMRTSMISAPALTVPNRSTGWYSERAVRFTEPRCLAAPAFAGPAAARCFGSSLDMLRHRTPRFGPAPEC
jgi:hypothetical protein